MTREQSNQCPNCGWTIPFLSKYRGKKNKDKFLCPDCGVALTYSCPSQTSLTIATMGLISSAVFFQSTLSGWHKLVFLAGYSLFIVLLIVGVHTKSNGIDVIELYKPENSNTE